MINKQVGIAIVAMGVVLAVAGIAYQQSVRNDISSDTTMMTPSQKKTALPQEAPVPDTIDGITESIVLQSTTGVSVLDDEEAGALQEIDTDSSSVNNLGMSYDENNL